ncbi:PepSY-like domain-containing protein [Myroides odoratimimus]|uniref:PepSY-like domain-containing protein n=1 Tax=Myroides odoratimimus TaxID=76832 RepID=UPI001CE06790|nr:PepSY-like domain-containing protein [Myroides odoratimimus]MCA4806521.1 PepSY-like domain-containing protein [Myroides odoratimimus]
MKKRKIALALMLAVALGFTACSSDDNGKGHKVEKITEEQLPANSKSFLKTVFPNSSLRHATKVTTPNYYGSLYATQLDNRVEIDFDKAGNWTEVEMEDDSAIPVEFLKSEVAHIYDYVVKNYKGISITEIDRDMKRGYEVKLSSGLELIFNTKQEFVGIDLDLDRDEELISGTDLPQKAQDFLKTHFTGVELVLVKKELDRAGDEYKVYLANGVKVEFTAAGEWKEIEAKRNVVIPSTVIPEAMNTYIVKNYNKFHIESIEKEHNTYQVELVNGIQEIELVFDQEGNFLRIDN